MAVSFIVVSNSSWPHLSSDLVRVNITRTAL